MVETVTAIRGFRLGRVLSLGFSIFFRNFVPFVLLAAIVFSPLIAYTALIDLSPANPDTVDTIEIWSVVVVAAGVPLNLVLNAALVYGTVQHMRGDPAPIGQCLAQGISRSISVVGVAVLAGLCIVFGLIVFIVPGLVIMTALWVAIPVAVVEKPGAVASLKRSIDLTAGYRWSIFGIIVLMSVIEQISSFIVESSAFMTNIAIANTNLYLVMAVGVTVTVSAIESVITAVGYHDLRLTKEGIGLDEIAAVFD